MLECFSLLYFNILFTNNLVKIRLLPQQNLICYLFELFNVQPIKFNQGGKINQLGFWCFILNTRRGTSPFNEQILWFTNIFFNENIWSVFDFFFFHLNYTNGNYFLHNRGMILCSKSTQRTNTTSMSPWKSWIATDEMKNKKIPHCRNSFKII